MPASEEPHPRRGWIRHGTDLLHALVRQALIQLTLAVGGILIVRGLGVDAYAHYAIAFSMVTAAGAISNSGVMDALTALVGRGLDDRRHVAGALAAAVRMRRRIALLAAAALVPLTAFLLLRKGAGVGETAVLLAVAAIANLLELHFAIATIVPWLRGHSRRLQEAELGGAVARLAAIALVGVVMPTAWAALATSALGVGLQLWLLRRWRLLETPAATPDPTAWQAVRMLVRRQWPNELNALLQAQSGLWLLTLFAPTIEVARYAALTRVSIVFTIILAALHRTIGARYAVAQAPEMIVRRYLQAMVVFTALGFVAWIVVALFAQQFLRLLGPHYTGNEALLRLAGLAALVGSLDVMTLWLNAMRGWIIRPAIAVPLRTGSLLVLALVIGVDSARAVFLIAIAMAIVLAATNISYFTVRLRASSS